MNVPAPEFLTDEQQLLYRRRGGFHIRPDTLRLLNTATGEPCFPPYRLYPIFYQELIFMSESTITHSANGVTCTIEMTADEYLVSTEPMLRMAALSKWATFPRGVSFAPLPFSCWSPMSQKFRRCVPRPGTAHSMRLFLVSSACCFCMCFCCMICGLILYFAIAFFIVMP